MSKFVKLGSNQAICNLDDLQVIARKELNSFQLVFRNCPVVIAADGNDVDAITALLDITVVERKPEPEIKSKLEVPND